MSINRQMHEGELPASSDVCMSATKLEGVKARCQICLRHHKLLGKLWAELSTKWTREKATGNGADGMSFAVEVSVHDITSPLFKVCFCSD